MSCIAPPRVSVCVLTFNRARLLRHAIESLLGQTLGDFELVVCDNASTDDTAEMVRGFRDPRIRHVRGAHNAGIGGNWARALEAAEGRYCAIFSDDDNWEPSFLERLVEPLERDARVDVAFCDHWVMDAERRLLLAPTDECSRAYGRAGLRPGLHLPFLDLALRRQALWHGAALVRRARAVELRAVDARADKVIDFYFFGRLALGGGGAFYVPDRLASAMRHPRSSAATSGAKIWADLQWVCERLGRDLPSGPLAAALRRKWATAALREAMSSLRQGDVGPGLRAAVRAARLGRLTPSR